VVELQAISEVSAAKALEPNEVAAANRNTPADRNFMMEPHCTPRDPAAGFLRKPRRASAKSTAPVTWMRESAKTHRLPGFCGTPRRAWPGYETSPAVP